MENMLTVDCRGHCCRRCCCCPIHSLVLHTHIFHYYLNLLSFLQFHSPQCNIQIGNLEDELCESRLESSKLKSELVSEKTATEIKLSELQSRINEYEEERLLGSGRTKIPGMKTKLELSWQKEREDQKRLLQETSTLARDLRQTLLEVERERDKERLENRRRIEQLERNNEEDLDEGRKKIAEL